MLRRTQQPHKKHNLRRNTRPKRKRLSIGWSYTVHTRNHRLHVSRINEMVKKILLFRIQSKAKDLDQKLQTTIQKLQELKKQKLGVKE